MTSSAGVRAERRPGAAGALPAASASRLRFWRAPAGSLGACAAVLAGSSGSMFIATRTAPSTMTTTLMATATDRIRSANLPRPEAARAARATSARKGRDRGGFAGGLGCAPRRDDEVRIAASVWEGLAETQGRLGGGDAVRRRARSPRAPRAGARLQRIVGRQGRIARLTILRRGTRRIGRSGSGAGWPPALVWWLCGAAPAARSRNRFAAHVGLDHGQTIKDLAERTVDRLQACPWRAARSPTGCP